jgi:hypothetical protein
LVGIGAVLVVSRLPQPITGAGTLDQCYWGWPVVKLDEGADPYLPVASWPTGLVYDEAAGVLRDASGDVLLTKGDRVAVKGSVIEVHGDPSPCFYTRGLNVEAIGPE